MILGQNRKIKRFIESNKTESGFGRNEAGKNKDEYFPSHTITPI